MANEITHTTNTAPPSGAPARLTKEQVFGINVEEKSMEQIIDQQQTEAPETIEFGGRVWTKKENDGDQLQTWESGTTRLDYFYVSQYPSGEWNWQRKFNLEFVMPPLMTDRATGIVATREEAMEAAIKADLHSAIDALIDTLSKAGLITHDNYQKGFQDGKNALKKAIMEN
ncbi:MAG: hypothetical protein AB7U30_11785 [Sulfuricellaceae bacterium]|jgi:hypothetical protein